MSDSKARLAAADEIGRLTTRIMKLAPTAGLHVGIKISSAKGATK
jgi:hypothetical protein